MDIKDLMLGDWVYNPKKNINQQVIGYDNIDNELTIVQEDGYVMNIESVDSVEPIPITEEWLKLNNMNKPFYCEDYRVLITEDDNGLMPYSCSIYLHGYGMIGIFNFRHVHELQNGIRLITKQDIELKF